MRINSCINFTSKLRSNTLNFKPPEKPLIGVRISDEKNEKNFYSPFVQTPTITYSYNGYTTKGKIEKIGIPNCHVYKNLIVRGESLSSKKNRKYVYSLKKNGIDSVIDLRDKYKSLSYEEFCKDKKLNYYHFPIDSAGVPDKTIIKNMPKMFKVLDNGHTYISCAQGLHRTDIALAIYYMFNPKQVEVPIMYGHIREEGFKHSDIATRINSLKRNITQEDLKKLGWDIDAFENEFTKRKDLFMTFNKMLAES